MEAKRGFGSGTPRRRILGWLPGVAASLFLVLAGCSEEELFGTGRGATAEASTPSGIQQGDVRLLFTLKDETVTSSDVTVSFSTNGGLTFSPAVEAPGGTGTEDLAVTPDGVVHVFVWDSAADLQDARLEDVRVRFFPRGGKSATTDAFPVHNRVFLCAAHAAETAEVSLWDLDLVEGDPRFLGVTLSGGKSPRGVLFRDDVFYVANTGTGNVSALSLDEEEATLAPLEGSPFSTGGIGSEYLAAGDDRLFVSNAAGGTIAIFDIQADGTLVKNVHSGASLSGCRELVVRGSELYVARESPAEIAIFDIEDDGELLESTFSPIAGAGMDSPRTLVRLGSYLYAVDFQIASASGFRFLGGGDLVEIAGSPFSFSDAGVVGASVHDGQRIFLAGGAASTFTELGVDDTGIAVEEAGSPFGAAGAVAAVVVAGDLLVAGTDALKLETRFVEDDGSLTAVEESPFDAPDEITGLEVSD